MTGFPLLLDVSGRRAVVAGGGTVGTRRALSLLEAGADVLVVDPSPSAELVAAAARRDPALPAGAQLTLARRPAGADDLAGAWLVFCCTSDPAVNTALAAAAQERALFCVRADDAAAGTARTPAVARRGGLTVAVNGDDDPGRARALRDAVLRGLDLGELPTRPFRPARGGSVALVGGGPGDPELITVRGRRLVAEADVLVVDRLAPRALLADLADDVEIVDCGKSPHRHNLTQDEINAVLVDRALAGRRVVRLKGGDPFVFGRGGEEWLACAEAGVPVTVVPGITSALAAPAAAAIPVTHRGVTAEFTVVSAHRDPGRDGDELDWGVLGGGTGTVVLLMAMERLEAVTSTLIAHGRDPRTPAAVVQHATLPGQRVLRAPLAGLAAASRAAGLGAPAVVVVGAVADVLAGLAGPAGSADGGRPGPTGGTVGP